jgi:dTDP-4-dehydrorhamnose reductase
MGGWYTYTDTVLRASTTFAERNPNFTTAVDFADRMSNPARAGEALSTADQYYGASAKAEAAALAAARLACQTTGGTWDEVKGCQNPFTIPTWLKIVGGLAVGGYALNAVRPFLGRS